jgi:hypothetical protein
MAKKNIRKVPETILERIRTFGQDDVVVACTKLLRSDDIAKYAHLGLTIGTDGVLHTPPPAVPNPKAGKYSLANVEGYEKVRKDLPMVTKTFDIESPNWGDPYYGTHTVSWTRDVYQRDFYPPKEVEMSITLVEARESGFIVKFGIEQVINRRTKNFEQELFYNLNLLQENVGAVDVFESTASLAEYAATVRVDWQILPPGTVDEVVRKMVSGRARTVTSEQEAQIRSRVQVLARLKPEAYIAGTDGFLRYFGAKFGDDFVVFENVRYGNAIYVMYEAWETISKRSRMELLSGPRDSFDRILHRDKWQAALQAKVEQYRERKRRK